MVKAKILSCKDGALCVLVDGVSYNFHIARPTPLTSKDARMILDNSLASMYMAGIMYPVERFDSKLSQLWHGFVSQMRKRDTTLYVDTLGVLIFLRNNALPMEIEGEECLVLTPRVLEKLRKGDLR